MGFIISQWRRISTSLTQSLSETDGIMIIIIIWASLQSDAYIMIEGIVAFTPAARDYIPAAVPSGAAQEARY